MLFGNGDDDNNNQEDTDELLQDLQPGFGGHFWLVHKFGGTSVANADCFLRVASILENQLDIASGEADCTTSNGDNDSSNNGDNGDNGPPKNLVAVVSAMGGKPKTTDLLLDAVRHASERDHDKVEASLNQVLEKYRSCLQMLFCGGNNDKYDAEEEDMENKNERDRLIRIIRDDLDDIRDILKTVALMKWQAQRISEVVSGYGELWSTQILAAVMTQRSESRKRRNRIRKSAAATAESVGGMLSAPPSLDESTNSSSYKMHEVQRPTHHKFVYLDARRVITIDEEAIQDGAVVWELSQAKFAQIYDEEMAKLAITTADDDNDDDNDEKDTTMLHFIVTGYVASNTDGVAVTLQRDGSDYSAAIMGRVLKANSVSIWTDVDGVLSADPRRVPNCQILPEVSYDEAMELAYFGAKVIHPKTMQPVISCSPQIPIYIRNTFNPSFPGTRIFLTSTTTTHDQDKVVCGFSSVERMALVNVEGSGLIGFPGVAHRIFGCLERAGINIVLISQASSEHSVTFATTQEMAVPAKETLEEEFVRELKQSRISSVDIRMPCSIIAAVGDGMYTTTGVSGRFFSALGDAKINVLAIAQGSSERNISAVVWSTESTRALRAVHAAFNLSHTTIRVGIVGMSEVGDSLLRLLETQRGALRSNFELDVQVCTVLPDGNSDDRIISLKNDTESGTDSITIGAYKALVEGGDAAVVFEDEENVARLSHGGLPSVVDNLFRSECASHAIFDCTNDETVGLCHADWLRAGIDVVTANNTGLSGTKQQRHDIKKAERALGKQSAKYLREVTVAGGLPVISTLRSLLHSGDKVRRIDGILTVVQSYVMYRISPPPDASQCSHFDTTYSNGAFQGDMSIPSSCVIGQACTFSQAVREAITLGLTEDDPIKDLNNEYAARVLMALARELGMDEGNETIHIQQSSDTLVKNFGTDFQHMPAEVDQQVQERVDAAKSRGCVLRSIASIDLKDRTIEIKILEVPHHHVFAIAPPSCSCVRFFTKRHMTYPLIVQGPSAGADSTASALLAELLQRARGISSPRSLRLAREGSGVLHNLN